MRDWPSITLRFPATAEGLPDLVSASLDGDGIVAIQERSDTEWLVSCKDTASRDAAVAAIVADWTASGVEALPHDVSDEDWARRSQAALGSIRAGRFLVRPPWHTPAADDLTPDTITLVIEPSMGFGSGHHATTRLCLEALQTLAVAGMRVLDIGTGSGILAIAAAMLGASEVTGTDNDPDALESARADAALNRLADAISFVDADFRATPPGAADIVLANLTGSMLAANASAIARCAVSGGRLVLSGITTAEADEVLRAWVPLARVIERRDADGWVGLTLEPLTAPAG